MSDELLPEDDGTLSAFPPEAISNDAEEGDEYEEISSEEVDRVVAALEELMESVDSENVRLHLEEALNSVFGLVYDDSDDALEEAA